MSGNLSTYRQPLLFYLALVALGAAIYANSLSNPLIFDDLLAIERNPNIRQLWPPTWLTSFWNPSIGVDGRPLVSFTLALNYAVGELSVEGYRATNIALHLLCAALLMALVRRTLMQTTVPPEFRRSAAFIAFASALIWMAHPLQSQAVNYITQRSESLMALCYLATLYCALRGFADRQLIWHPVAVLCCALGMGAKESMVTAPVVVLLYHAAYGGRSISSAWRANWPLYAGLGSTWVLSAALLWNTPHGDSIGFGSNVGAWDYLLNQSVVISRYLSLLFVPHPLTIDYGVPRLGLMLGDVAPHLLLVVLLLALSVISYRRHPRTAFLGLWFFLLLTPTSSIVPIVNEVGADRRAYLPLVGIVILVVVAAHWAGLRIGDRVRRSTTAAPAKREYGVWSAWMALAVVAVALSIGTIARNTDYRTTVSIWASAVAALPENWRAHHNLAKALAEDGQAELAARHYEEALRLNPGLVKAWYNLANLLKSQGQVEQSEVCYLRALAIEADFAAAHYNLALLLDAAGRRQEAAERFLRAFEAQPGYYEAAYNLANTLRDLGRAQEAETYYRRALELHPEYVEAHNNLALLLAARGRRAEAIKNLHSALRIAPGSAQLQRNLSHLLEQTD